jgi:hypothetical protein
VPTGSALQRDRAVSGGDIAATVARFGSNDAGPGAFDRNSDPVSTPNPAVVPSGNRQNYHPAYDRGGSILGGDPWDLLPPNGSISGGDIAALVVQFGHSCHGPFPEIPWPIEWMTGANTTKELAAFLEPIVLPVLPAQQSAQAPETAILGSGAIVLCTAPDGTVWIALPEPPPPEFFILTPVPDEGTPAAPLPTTGWPGADGEVTPSAASSC